MKNKKTIQSNIFGEVSELDKIDNFKRPEFKSDDFPKIKNKKPKIEMLKNENWFYIEFYQEDEKFKELENILRNKLKTRHEIDRNWFYKIIKEMS